MANANSNLGIIEKVVTKSSLIFRAELQKINAPNTTPVVIDNKKTAMLAKVKDVIRAPENIQVGNEIILQLNDEEGQTDRQI